MRSSGLLKQCHRNLVDNMTADNVRFGLIKVSRDLEGVKFVDSTLSDDEEQFLLLEIVRGNPVGHFARMEIRDEQVYLQTLQGTTDEANISISLANVDRISDALIFNQVVSNYIKQYHQEIGNTFRSDLSKSLKYLATFDDLDGILFAVFTSVKMVVLGSEDENRKFIVACLNLLPPEIAKIQKFHTFSERIDTELNWVGMPPVQASLDQVQGLEFSHTIVSTTKNKASTPYSCDILSELAELIQNDQIERAIDEIMRIYEMARNLSPSDDASIIADEIESSINDAEFIIRVRDTISDITITHPSTWR